MLENYLFWKYYGYGYELFEFYSNEDIILMARNRMIYPAPATPHFEEF